VIEPWVEHLHRVVSGARAHAGVVSLAGFHRVQASPGYDAAAEWVAAQLAGAGLTVERTDVPGDGRTRFLGGLMPQGWACTEARAMLVDAHGSEPLCDAARAPLSVILRSAPARGRYRLVAVDDGATDAHYEGVDVRGAIVLASGPVHRVVELAVRERGAAGLLSDTRRLLPPVRGPFDDADALAYTSFWWNGDEPRAWGFVVSPATGARLRQRLRNGEALSLEVSIEAVSFDTRIPLVSGVLPGAAPDGEEVLVVSHLCHPEPSANDNASGAAANLEAACALAALARDGVLPAHRRAVRFLWVPELTGTYAWVAAHPERMRRTVAALNLDMVGEDQARCGSTFLLEHPPCFAGSFAEELARHVRQAMQDWVTSFSGPGHYSLARLAEVPYSGGSDHVVLVDPAVGVPCPMLVQWPDLYYHSSHDTPDKVSPASLALAARTAAGYAGFLACAGPAETEWLTALVARGARRRLLAAADGADAGLGVPEPAWRSRRSALDDFCAREGFLAHDEVLRPHSDSGGAPVPARVHGGALEFLPRLWPGYPTLTRAEREAWREFQAGAPGGTTLFDVAWFACDGERTLDDIAELVWLETGHHVPEVLERFFAWMARLGLAHGREPDQGR
jgi:peptidase M28-like protein